MNSPDPVLPREAADAYRAHRPLRGLTVTGNVLSTYKLTATATAPALPEPVSASMTVMLLPCLLLEVGMLVSLAWVFHALCVTELI